MSSSKIAIIVVVLAIVGLGLASVFTVEERELAIKFRLGEIVRSDYEPGLHFKVPFINNIRKFDARILTLDARPAIYLTQEKKNVNVDFYVKWRIKDVRAFYTSMSGGNERTAMERIYTVMNDNLRVEFGKRNIQEVISGERRQIMDTSQKVSNEQVERFGIQIVDLRIKRIDFSEQISESVFRRMEAERIRVAKDFRSRGAEAAEKIRADADRQRTVLVANAYREAQQVRGEGDGKAADIYARAFSKDAEFYAFYRSLNAYRNAFGQQGDILVLEPDNKFFKYFKDSNAK